MNDSIVCQVQRDLDRAKAPGLGVHDGKARVDVSQVEYIIRSMRVLARENELLKAAVRDAAFEEDFLEKWWQEEHAEAIKIAEGG